jgi:hypothetical protein
MGNDPNSQGAGCGCDVSGSSLTESDWKWIELLRTNCDAKVPAPDFNQIVDLRELEAVESQMAL